MSNKKQFYTPMDQRIDYVPIEDEEMRKEFVNECKALIGMGIMSRPWKKLLNMYGWTIVKDACLEIIEESGK